MARRRRSTFAAPVPRRRSYRRRRNPGFRMPGLGGFKLPPIMPAVWGLGGYLAAAAIPNLILGAKAAETNKGVVGYALEIAAGSAAAVAARAVGGTQAMTAVLTGVGIRVAHRIAREQGLLAKIPGLGATEAYGETPGFAGYIDSPLTGMIDASQTPQFLPELALSGYQGDYEYDFLAQ